MRKLLFIVVSMFIYNIYSLESQYTVIDNGFDNRLEIYSIENETKILQDIISYNIFNAARQYVLNKNFLFLVGNNNLLIKYDILQKKLFYTKIPCDYVFSISCDGVYVCTTIKTNVKEEADSNTQDVLGTVIHRKQLFPFLYDIASEKRIKEFYITEVQDYIGATINIRFDNKKKAFFVSYVMEYPYSIFCGNIFLDNFRFEPAD